MPPTTLHTYIPQDRLRALARGEALPDLADGTALFADVSGFTPLTEKLTRELGTRRGVEELTLRINSVYDAIIGEVNRFGGSVINFAGDAITCWFDCNLGEPAVRAITCAQAMQAAMRKFPGLSVKVALTSGPVRRFATGNPETRLIDTLAGVTVARLATAEHLAKAGEILLDPATLDRLHIPPGECRTAETGECFFVLAPSFHGREPSSIPETPPAEALPASLDTATFKPWVLPVVYEKETAGQGLFLTELRPTTALFIRFLGIDYDNDPLAKEKLDQIISGTQILLEHHGGTLLELTIGDKGSYLYASFGASHVHENDARRAVQVCLEIRQLYSELAFLNVMQFGLSSGTMRVGAYGSKTRQSFGALGDEVNLAARLMTTAASGEILVSGRVRKALSDDFMVEARPPIPIKGKAEPLTVFAVSGMQQKRAIRLQEPTYTLPMIGRQQELSLINEKIKSVLQGRGQIVGITAEAGMGKSRLAAEAIRLARRNKLVGYGSACESDGTNTPYLVWQSVWNAYFDIDPLSPLRKKIRSIEGELDDRVPEHIDTLPLLGTVLGLSLPENDFTRGLQPKDRKTQLETVLIKCLQSSIQEAAEEGGGLLLVLEDLHWIDPVSFDLLELAADAIENLPALILLTYRPPEISQQRQMLARLERFEHFTQIKLTELNMAETEQVIRSKLSQLFPERAGGIPPLLVQRITSRAQGNPFYMEELLNYFHDRGIDPHDAGALEAFDLPTSLHSLILSRFDQLTSSQQLDLKVASIIGRVFPFLDLHNYYPSLGTTDQLKADLQELERLGLTPLESPEPELIYLFKHLVMHEVGYESIAYTTRAKLHGEYARYLESAYPDRIDQMAPQLAHHYEQARTLEKACLYLSKSGEQAAANYANDEALSYFNRTLNLLPETDIRARFDILFKRERIYDLQGKRIEQRQDLKELARLANQFSDAPSLRAQIAIRQARLEIDEGNNPEAKTNVQAAIREIEADEQLRAQSTNLLVDAILLEARIMFLTGQVVAAKPHLEHALALAREKQYPRGEYNALAQLGLWNWYGGDYAAAADLLEQSLHKIQQAGDIRREIDILNNLGIITKDRYKFTEALGYYERAQKIAKKIGDRSGEASLLANMGRACIVACDYPRTERYCAQAAALAAEVHEPTTQGLALHNRSEAFRELGQYTAAKAAAEEALPLLRAAGYRVGEANILDNLALIEFALGEREQAFEHVQTALTITREIAARRVEASFLINLGLMQLAMGQLDAAEQAFLESQTIKQELKEPVPMLEVQAGLAGVKLERGGAGALETAQELIDEILHEPPTEQSHILPLWLYWVGIRVLSACNDPRVTALTTRAIAELHTRSAKITATDIRHTYENIPEHHAILKAGGTHE